METLKTNSDFDRVRKAGRTWAVGPVVLNAAPNGLDTIRCGFVAGKKVGGAVVRNRARRLIKEAVRPRLPLLRTGWDLVWIARSSIAELKAGDVAEAVDEALNRGKLYASGDSATWAAQSRIMERRDPEAAGPEAAQRAAAVTFPDTETK
jgi:ribonuclease P protein component